MTVITLSIAWFVLGIGYGIVILNLPKIKLPKRKSKAKLRIVK